MKKTDTLILGAYGCGVFCNNVRDVARLFYESLNNRYEFIKDMKICFAIYDKSNEIINIFKKELVDNK